MTTEVTIADYRRGLDLAVNMLMRNEPPDSRAVSDEVVALAAFSGRRCRRSGYADHL